MGWTDEQIDIMISTLQDKRKHKQTLITQKQAEIDQFYEKPRQRVEGCQDANPKTFWTKDIKEVIFNPISYSVRCFTCDNDSIFKFTDRYGIYYLCLNCGQEIMVRAGISLDLIKIE